MNQSIVLTLPGLRSALAEIIARVGFADADLSLQSHLDDVCRIIERKPLRSVAEFASQAGIDVRIVEEGHHRFYRFSPVG